MFCVLHVRLKQQIKNVLIDKKQNYFVIWKKCYYSVSGQDVTCGIFACQCWNLNIDQYNLNQEWAIFTTDTKKNS